MPIPTEMGFSFPSFGAEDANPTQGDPAQPNLQNSPKKGAPEDHPSQQQAGKPATEVQLGEGIPFAKGPFGMTMGMRSKGPSTAGSGRVLVDTPWELRPDGKDAVVETDVLERNALATPNDESGDSRGAERLPTQRLLRGRSVAVHRSNPTTPSTVSKYPPSAAMRAVPGFCPHSTPLSSVKDALFLGWEAQPCMTYQEAFDFLKSKKKEVSPNIGFVLALRELAGGGDFSLSSSL
ncbi:unnamed protein product [Phytomonas sp. EM1]|nr:unnamed protein product [Phytomonas sp. EM1]|eukprot:CCW61325.1 unnamed protein product [Phytomonas sp. isolate EM1]